MLLRMRRALLLRWIWIKLEYISSAGLRVVMKLRKAVEKRLELVNVSPGVYDILEKSSFTSMMNVQEKLPESNDEGSEK